MFTLRTSHEAGGWHLPISPKRLAPTHPSQAAGTYPSVPSGCHRPIRPKRLAPTHQSHAVDTDPSVPSGWHLPISPMRLTPTHPSQRLAPTHQSHAVDTDPSVPTAGTYPFVPSGCPGRRAAYSKAATETGLHLLCLHRCTSEKQARCRLTPPVKRLIIVWPTLIATCRCPLACGSREQGETAAWLVV